MSDLVVREIGTDKEIARVKLTKTSEQHVDRVVNGLMMTMDLDKYYVDESEVEASDE